MTTVRRMTEAETAPSTTNREGDTEDSSTSGKTKNILMVLTGMKNVFLSRNCKGFIVTCCCVCQCV